MKEDKLWYRQPAQEWTQGLPIGNGRQGCMIMGNPVLEHIQMNEETVWSGAPEDKTSPSGAAYLGEIRHLLRKEQYGQAQKLLETHMLGPWQEAYEPLGDFFIQDQSEGSLSDSFGEYCRELNLDTGIAKISYVKNGIQYYREYFASYPDDIVAICLRCDKENSICVDAFLNSPLRYSLWSEDDCIRMEVVCPTHSEPSHLGPCKTPLVYDADKESIHAQVCVKAIVEQGECYTSGSRLIIRNATSVVFLISMATSFNGYRRMPVSGGKDAAGECDRRLRHALTMDYVTLKKRHCMDYQSLYKRVSFYLEDEDKSQIPTDVRLEGIRKGNRDLGMITLMFQYGRYLLISSSRPGTQPANLQGIWNQDIRPPWCSNYTLNINAQMNYWPAEICNLSECHEPFFQMLEELSESGRETAEKNLNCRGWIVNHTTTLWRHTTPTSKFARYSFFPLAGAWCCRHLWEHYLYTKDKRFLRETAYPIMKGAVEFCLDWLVCDEEGYLVTSPSTSPENSYCSGGIRYGVTEGSAIDLSIIGELLEHFTAMADVLGVEDELAGQAEIARRKLRPLQIGSDGTLLEWGKEFEEFEPGHRHVSHLYGAYPAALLTPERNVELYEAARKSLIKRLENGGGHTGWSCAWIINLWARFCDGQMANHYVMELLKRSCYPNLFDAHPPFQIDGNFGFTSGVAEMLLQSHEGYIHLLPACSPEWEKGAVTGLVARGAFQIDMQWEYGSVTQAVVYSKKGGVCKIKDSGFQIYHYGNEMPVEHVRRESGLILFNTKEGDRYLLLH